MTAGHKWFTHLNKIDTSLIDGRSETDHVPDDSAAQRHEGGFPVQSQLQRPVQDHGHALERLVLLSVGQHDRVHPKAVAGLVLLLQQCLEALEVEGRDAVVGDEQRALALDVRAEQGRGLGVGELGTDVDRIIAPVGEVDLHDVEFHVRLFRTVRRGLLRFEFLRGRADLQRRRRRRPTSLLVVHGIDMDDGGCEGGGESGREKEKGGRCDDDPGEHHRRAVFLPLGVWCWRCCVLHAGQNTA